MLAAGAAGVDPDLAQVKGGHGIADEADKVIAGHLIAEIGGEQERSVVIHGCETGSHVGADASRARLFKTMAESKYSKSNRLLAPWLSMWTPSSPVPGCC